MTDRKTQILHNAIRIIVNEGYAALSMRALARASGLKLGAMQYHYRTREDMLRALVAYVADWYLDVLNPGVDGSENRIVDMLALLTNGGVIAGIDTEKLWPQLWAMSVAEPLVKELLNDVYESCRSVLEERLTEIGSEEPRLEALAMMSLIDGATLILQINPRWQGELVAVSDLMVRLLTDKYGIKKSARKK